MKTVSIVRRMAEQLMAVKNQMVTWLRLFTPCNDPATFFHLGHIAIFVVRDNTWRCQCIFQSLTNTTDKGSRAGYPQEMLAC